MNARGQEHTEKNIGSYCDDDDDDSIVVTTHRKIKYEMPKWNHSAGIHSLSCTDAHEMKFCVWRTKLFSDMNNVYRCVPLSLSPFLHFASILPLFHSRVRNFYCRPSQETRWRKGNGITRPRASYREIERENATETKQAKKNQKKNRWWW